MKLHGIDIEPGMIIETKDEFNRSHGYWVAVPTRMLEHSIVFVNAQCLVKIPIIGLAASGNQAQLQIFMMEISSGKKEC